MSKLKDFRRLIRVTNLYPPYLFSGIRIVHVNDDFTQIEVRLKQTWYNRNIFGSHFGGSLYAMCDPFYVFIVLANFGKEYVVWDKSAAIRFKRPGYGKVTAKFRIDPSTLQIMKSEVDEHGKRTYHFNTQVLDEKGAVVAEVDKEIYIRKK